LFLYKLARKFYFSFVEEKEKERDKERQKQIEENIVNIF